MDPRHSGKLALTRSVISGLVVFALLQTTRTADALSWLTRPAVLAVMGLFGGTVSDGGSDLVIGNLRVPWTRDCAGFDVLLVLWGLIIWTSRHEPLARRFWLRMAGAVPAAVVANIARVLTIIAWRKAFYPAVESPQTHYFIGFLWLLPLLFLFIPRGGKPLVPWLAGLLMPAAALSLAAPQASAPGGVLVSACALLLLGVQHFHRLSGMLEIALGVLWFLAAAAIAGSGMESLWLPWLLACPWHLPRAPWLRISAVLLPGTVPLVAMNLPWLVAGLLVATILLLWWRHDDLRIPADPRPVGALGMAGLGITFLIPFCASTLGPVMRETSTPPPGLMARPLDPGNWQLQLPLQSPLVTLIWFAPSGTGRHHTLPVCLSYRGRKLVPDPGAKCLYHDNELWLTEAFLMPDGELCDYPAYLRRTLVPFSSPGVHLIASAPRGEIDPARFESTARRLFEQVAALANEARSGSQALPAR